ncbi:MAG: hypothetical protein P9L94_03820 [Candidatus Hinthialibacter antarcticus]|nr:hypothetical protein [Candidatus Hinthialibacter antarcticus]
MKRFIQAIWLSSFVLLIVGGVNVQAQLVGDMRVQSALLLSDALLLDQATTDNIVEKYSEISGKLWQEAQNSGQDFQSMSDEERRKAFSDFRKKTIVGMHEGLKDTLSEEQLKEVEPVMMVRVFSPSPELRALRLTELKDEQKTQLQPLALSVTKKMVPSNFAFFGSQMSEEEREKAQTAFDEELASFKKKINAVLNEEQKAAWQEKIDAINKEIEELRAQRQNR